MREFMKENISGRVLPEGKVGEDLGFVFLEEQLAHRVR
jgi:hypothetical protein